MATVLTINGVQIGRYAIGLNQFQASMDGPGSLTFTQIATFLPGQFRKGQAVTLTVDGTLVFSGVIVSLYPQGVGAGPINIGYRCYDLNWQANQVWITNTTGVGKLAYNLPETDPSYVASQSALNVGQILSAVYNLHSTQLSALGITSFNSSDLSVLTIVPPDPVIMTGRLWNCVLALMTTYYNSYGSWVTAAGVIRHMNLLTLSTTTFTLDALDGSSNPCVLDSISEDFSECYTQVVIRGSGNIQGANLSLTLGATVPVGSGSLQYGWSAAQQAAWTYGQYINPPGAWEQGTIGGMTSTSLSVTATNPIPVTYTSTSWWSSLDAEVWAYTLVGGASVFNEQRRITAITVPSGNSYTITVDAPFSNTGYTNYQIRGLTSFQGATTPADVWRKFYIVPANVASALVQQFSHSVPWTGGVQDVVVQTTTPMANVTFTSGLNAISWPMSFQVIPWGSGTWGTQATATLTYGSGKVTGYSGLSGGAGYQPSQNNVVCQVTGGDGYGAIVHAVSNSSGVITSLVVDYGGSGYTSTPNVLIGVQTGYIEFYQPICTAYCSQATLNAGGASIPAPTDIQILVPYSLGALTAQAPSSGYSGTAYTVNGVQRTLYYDYPEFMDYANQANYTALATQKLNCVMNTVVEGSITYYGKQTTFFTLGQAVNIAGNGYTTGYEAINAPARSVVLDFAPDGGAAQWITRIGFSTRMKPFTGDRLYDHPAYLGSMRSQVGGFGAAWGTAASMSGIDTGGNTFNVSSEDTNDYSSLMPGSAGATNRIKTTAGNLAAATNLALAAPAETGQSFEQFAHGLDPTAPALPSGPAQSFEDYAHLTDPEETAEDYMNRTKGAT